MHTTMPSSMMYFFYSDHVCETHAHAHMYTYIICLSIESGTVCMQIHMRRLHISTYISTSLCECACVWIYVDGACIYIMCLLLDVSY